MTNTAKKDLQKDLIIAEFSHISQTAFQCNEDRARVSQVYYGTFGTLLLSVLATQVDGVDINQLHLIFGLLFLINALFGIITITQLAKLRLAWMSATHALNQLKEKAYGTDGFEELFIWHNGTIPKAFAPFSISSLSTGMAAVLTGVSAGASTVFFRSVGKAALDINGAIGAGVVVFLLCLGWYWWLMQRKVS